MTNSSMKSGMRALVIGSKGMLGSELVRTLCFAGNDVTGWDHSDCDVTDSDATRKAIFGLRPDVIFNAVAYNAVDACEESEAEYGKAWRLNALVPGQLAAVAKELDAVFVHFSTDYVFDGEAIGGYDEDAEPHPVSRYGDSKLGGERSVQQVGGRYSIIRLSKLFGRSTDAVSGKRNFFEKMRERADAKTLVQVVDDERGCFTYAPDLAEATYMLVVDRAAPGIYHLMNEGTMTWYEAAREYFRIAGIDSTVGPISGDAFPRPARRPRDSTLLNRKRPKLRPFIDALQAFAATEIG